MIFNNNSKLLKLKAEYIEYRDILKLEIKFLFFKLALILKNTTGLRDYKSIFKLHYPILLDMESNYNKKLNKLYIHTSFFIIIKIHFALNKNQTYIDNSGFFNYLKIMKTERSKQFYKDYYPYNIKVKDIKLIAYYLTQFHTIPENDLWWGKGFTEWTNVTKAIPQFKGHYQPRLPGDLGFYDLRVKEVHQKQVEMAKNYGIYGFCYYFYWFKGKRLLEKPLDLVINNPDLDFPFCLFWANESWARNWDGSEKDILIKQEYSEEDDLNLIKFLVPIFKDKRYIRVDNKPLINIYRPNLMPDMKKTINTWKEYCKTQGIDDLYVTISNTHSIENPNEYGANAAIEYAMACNKSFNINNLSLYNSNYTSGAWLINYEDVINTSINKQKPNYKEFRSLCPDWDNEARRSGGKGGTIVNSTPSLYKYWLEKLIKYTKENFDESERIIFINAWNEWAEGAYLEPDFKYGYSYLDATSRALIDSNSTENFNKDYIYNIKRFSGTHYDFNIYNFSMFNKVSSDNMLLNDLASKIKKSVLVFDHNSGGGADLYLSNKIDSDIINDNELCYIVVSKFETNIVEFYFKEDKYKYCFNNLEDIEFMYLLFNIKEIFINNLFLYADLRKIINYIINIYNKYKIDIVYPIHDYLCICKNLDLLNDDKVFCNIPIRKDIHICNNCEVSKVYNITEYRNNFQKLFDICKKIIVFSESSKKYLNKVFKINQDKIDLIPHKVTWIKTKANKSSKKERLRVGILGDIAINKGHNIVKDLIEISLQNNAAIDYYCIGQLKEKLNYSNLFVTGRYDINKLVEIVNKYDIDIFIMPSIWPETFSYVTEEIILMNKPIISFNIGAQGEKVSKYVNGFVVDEITAKAIYDILINYYNNIYN